LDRTAPAARSRDAVAVGPGVVDAASAVSTEGIARAIEERVIAALRRGPSDAYGLSPREHEVLTIVAEGRTDREIAARLFISERTVHVHVRRVLAKLGVASRTEAAGLAIRQGLVPGGPSTSASGARPSRPGAG
jgi:DNA-binding NarL/FixJ family response regulator